MLHLDLVLLMKLTASWPAFRSFCSRARFLHTGKGGAALARHIQPESAHTTAYASMLCGEVAEPRSFHEYSDLLRVG